MKLLELAWRRTLYRVPKRGVGAVVHNSYTTLGHVTFASYGARHRRSIATRSWAAVNV